MSPLRRSSKVDKDLGSEWQRFLCGVCHVELQRFLRGVCGVGVNSEPGRVPSWG